MKMKCEYDNEITLKALNILHRDILLGDAEAQVADLETLVQLVRYFASRSGGSTLAEEAENLERAAIFLTLGGELRHCRFPEAGEERGTLLRVQRLLCRPAPGHLGGGRPVCRSVRPEGGDADGEGDGPLNVDSDIGGEK